ncbi:MAG: Alanine racemase 1 [Anaerolineales bacterium]|nr:Alanine racemase 1 [Anaerolineales bacterium]
MGSQALIEGCTWAEIDLGAIAHNVRAIKKHIGPAVELCAVVKANAYGHGAEAVARTALVYGAGRLAVARLEEATALRRAGICAPILVLGPIAPNGAASVISHELTPTVNSPAVAQALSQQAQAADRTVAVHLKVDTGMGRFGVLPEEVVSFAREILSLPGLRLQGFWTHFAVADEADKTYTRRQFSIYHRALRNLETAGFQVEVRHVANSAATLDLPETHLDMVRCGIALYGLYPSPDVGRAVSLRPALALKARVGRVRTLTSGSSISYGRTYTTQRDTRVALVPFGYGDGYPRLLSNRGQVLIGGRRCPIVGRVCMDLFVVDVSAVPDVGEGDEVVLLGRQGDEVITAEELAGKLGTINYEVVTGLAARVPRVYLNEPG